jgi:hypothetical protein
VQNYLRFLAAFLVALRFFATFLTAFFAGLRFLAAFFAAMVVGVYEMTIDKSTHAHMKIFYKFHALVFLNISIAHKNIFV